MGTFRSNDRRRSLRLCRLKIFEKHLPSFLHSATQTKNFLSSFRLSAEESGEEPCIEMEGSFWVCPRESASAVEARSSASGAYEKLSSLPRASTDFHTLGSRPYFSGP